MKEQTKHHKPRSKTFESRVRITRIKAIAILVYNQIKAV